MDSSDLLENFSPFQCSATSNPTNGARNSTNIDSIDFFGGFQVMDFYKMIDLYGHVSCFGNLT